MARLERKRNERFLAKSTASTRESDLRPLERDLAAFRRDFFARLESPLVAEELFDTVRDVVFFVKDRQGRYVAANHTLVERCGCRRREDLLGKTADEVFPPPLGASYREQDAQVLERGQPIVDRLELHLFPSGVEGWCLTHKSPLFAKGQVVGLVGISRDLNRESAQISGGAATQASDHQALAELIAHVQAHLAEPLRVPELARRAGLSIYQLDLRLRRLFGLSPGQFVARARIDRACHLLRATDSPIADIALDCGYGDQSALHRAFRNLVGLSPKRYRESHR